MKAIVYEKSKSQDCLILREIEKPLPGENEVLIEIFTGSVNAADYRSMKMGIIPKKKIFGADIAGRVEAVGKNVKNFAVGEEVVGDLSSCGFGGFAEYVAAPENALILKPALVNFETAAAVPLAAVTALQALRNKRSIQSGESVLICGAGGGVGTFLVQLAKYFGAEVTAVCGTNNVNLVRSIGADHVLNYNEDDFTKSRKRYDLVLGINGNNTLSSYKRALTPKGTFVMVGGALPQVIKSLLFGSFLSIGSKKMRTLAAKPNTKDLELIMKLVEEGKIKPVIDRCYPLNKTAEAMRYISQGHSQGKVIINVKKVN